MQAQHSRFTVPILHRADVQELFISLIKLVNVCVCVCEWAANSAPGTCTYQQYENLDRVDSSWRKRAHFTVTHIQTATHSFFTQNYSRFKSSRLPTTRIIWCTCILRAVRAYSCCWTSIHSLFSRRLRKWLEHLPLDIQQSEGTGKTE